jgi:RNA polymerase sigma-70 factor (ECF subfamily)
VRLFYLEGRSYEEISTELNIPVNSIGAILARARKKLRGED